jgi:hypothetical protein
MLLFPHKNEKTAGTEQTFYVLSDREIVTKKISQLLQLAGFSHIELLRQSLKTAATLPVSAKARGIIIDVGQEANAEESILAIKTLIPRGIWCCVVGEQDSITLAQTYARQGLHYFYIGAEDEELIRTVVSGKTLRTNRWAVNISILGCKGGVGNTTIAHQMVNKIVQRRQLPTLFIQGKSGSHDLDLLFGKKMNQDVIPVNKHLDLMCLQDDVLPQLKYETAEKYNFVVFEEMVNSSEKEHVRQIIEHSSCLILTLDRSMSSVRVARQLIEINESINRSQYIPRRLFICVSDSRPVSSEMLSLDDIQSLIHHKIDFLFPWIQTNARSYSFTLKKKITPIDALTQRVLGT